MGEDDRDTREIAIEALDVAHKASHRADLATNHSLEAHGAIGKVAGEMGRLSDSTDALKLAMISGFEKLGVQLNDTHGVALKAGATAKKAREKADSFAEDFDEITKVRDLRKELRGHRAQRKWIIGIFSAVLTAVLAALVIRSLVH
jgi:hypothetical protein